MIPWHLKGDPFPVQQKALDTANLKHGFAYWMEMGLGKTGVIFNEITDLYLKDEIKGSIVWCPNSLKRNWRDEAEKMGYKGDIYIWPNEVKNIDITRLFTVMMNFEAIITKKGESFIEELIKSVDGKIYGAIDESSAIKNPRSKRTLALIYHSLRMEYTRVASGTPVSQSIADTWAQLKFIGATPLRFFPFRNRYCELGGYMGKQIVGAKNLFDFYEKHKNKVFIAKKKDWTDLPKKLPPIIRTPQMADHQRKIYQEMLEDFFVEIGDHEIEVNMAITQLQKLQQIVSGFIRDNDRKVVHLFDSPLKIPKVVSMMEAIEESYGKCIVFCVNKPSIDICLEALKDRNPAFIRGGMTDDDREEQKHKFNDDSTCRDIVVQIQSGGKGLTLLGQPGDDRCATTIFFESDFSLENRLQAEDRNHRHGQDTDVTYIDFASTSIEHLIAKSLGGKESLANTITNPSFWDCEIY